MAIHIEARQLDKTFHSDNRLSHAYKNLSFAVAAREFYCIVGPSGCGKSTLLRTVAGLEQATKGELDVNHSQGKPSEIAMVFQEQGLFPWMSVQKNISFLLENNPRFAGSDIKAIAGEYLDKVALSRCADMYPHELSGGMRQRVSIARAFAVDPDILLMDEPFVFLDYQTRLVLVELLLQLWLQTHKTILFVTHDIEEAVLLADRVMIMSAHPGQVKEIINIDIDHPRDIFDIKKSPDYLDYVEHITQSIREEMSISQDSVSTPIDKAPVNQAEAGEP